MTLYYPARDGTTLLKGASLLLVNVPQLGVQQAGLSSIDLGQVAIGPITVGDLVLTNTSVALNAGRAVARNVNVHVTLSLSLEWEIGISVNDILDIHEHHTTSLGSVGLDMPQTDITLPALSNISVAIPSLTAQSVSVQADPLALSLHNATADNLNATNVVLPSAGFSIAGLSLNSIDGTNVTVPAAKLERATVDHLHGDAVAVPALGLSNLSLGSAHADSIVNTAPLDLPVTLRPSHEPGFDAGILKVILHITANATAHIPFLEINDVSASASVGRIAVHNVSIPYDVHNLTLSQVGITAVSVPAFNVS
ncbi:MAG TPA: hypothetical protein VGJ60_35725 [Chloroflexota bacterium]